VIRRDLEITLAEISPADVRTAVNAHEASLDWSGDSFMAGHWLGAEHRAVVVDGESVGVTGWTDDGLSLLTLSPAARQHDRQVAEVVLRESGARTAYVASWDAHHLAVLGAFATGIASQAYQFRLSDPDDLRAPVAGLSLRRATPEDLPWLESTGFQDDYVQYLEGNALSVALLDQGEVGIAVHVPHVLADAVVDIGMYVDPVLRRRGLGSSILALTARDVLAQGRTPVAGCWWKNWASRVTLEAAGLTCAGTIFRLDLDPDTFAAAGGFEARA
jgi:GNAT superfamily N-acetyltransferase